MERRPIPVNGTREERYKWLEMVTRYGRCALSEMESARRALPEIYGMLRECQQKKFSGSRISAYMTIKVLKVSAIREQRTTGAAFFFEDLEESLRHGRRGMTLACLVIRRLNDGYREADAHDSLGVSRRAFLQQVAGIPMMTVAA